MWDIRDQTPQDRIWLLQSVKPKKPADWRGAKKAEKFCFNIIFYGVNAYFVNAFFFLHQ